jgi:hypothetical protein
VHGMVHVMMVMITLVWIPLRGLSNVVILPFVPDTMIVTIMQLHCDPVRYVMASLGLMEVIHFTRTSKNSCYF